MTTLATSNPVVTVQGPLTTNGATGIIGQPAQATTTTTYPRAHGGAYLGGGYVRSAKSPRLDCRCRGDRTRSKPLESLQNRPGRDKRRVAGRHRPTHCAGAGSLRNRPQARARAIPASRNAKGQIC